MAPQYIISQMLENGSNYPENVSLLKKIILTCYLGRLRINGQSPDNTISLSDYLFDNERIMFDYTRLSEQSRERFLKWLLDEHQAQKEKNTFIPYYVNDYRGFTAEYEISWWRRIKNWYKGLHSSYWRLNHFILSRDYQLNGIEIVDGKNGTLIGFDQHMVPDSEEKYGNPDVQTMLNAKRVNLTDNLVEQLVSNNFGRGINIPALLKRKHPQAIFVSDKKRRAEDMLAYRITQRFNTLAPWYVLLWNWILSFFISPAVEEPTKNDPCGLIELVHDPERIPFDDLLELIKNQNAIILFNKKLYYADVADRQLTVIKKTAANQTDYLELEKQCNHSYALADSRQHPILSKLIKKPEYNVLYSNDTVQIMQRVSTGEIRVNERKPIINNLVFCGGGAKIFAHSGVWKALNDSSIKPTQFAGSSAGAIMALLCYLGFNSVEINEFFTKFKKEDLMYFDVDTKGLSDSHSLKTALDFIIARKVKEITSKYKLPYPTGKITFATLDQLRQRYPGCGLGEELVVTGTQKKARKTFYFSHAKTPNMEVSEAVKISASFPILYRPTLLDGEEFNDGGILSNFPTEAFTDDHSTFLESEDGNSLKVLAVQFDNGTERGTIDRIQERVYREGLIENWFYKLATGVSDPVSSWVEDRNKLRKYAMQSIIVDVGNVTSSSFSVTQDTRQQMFNSGYKATKDYIEARFDRSCEDLDVIESRELMYSTFSSLGDLLTYCCYRRNKEWFEIVNNLIAESKQPNKAELVNQSIQLRALYFMDREPAMKEPEVNNNLANSSTFYGNALGQPPNDNHNYLLALYPIFLHFSTDFVYLESDKAIYDAGRHQVSLNNPFGFLRFFKNFEGEAHLLLHVFIQLAEKLKYSQTPEAYANLNLILNYLRECKELNHPDFYQAWDLSALQVQQFLDIITDKEALKPDTLFDKLHHVVASRKPSEQGVQNNHDNADNRSNERNRFSARA